jgi:hypothetical protein
MDRVDELAPVDGGIGLALLLFVVAHDDGLVHLRGVNAARRFCLRALTRRSSVGPGFVEESGHQVPG